MVPLRHSAFSVFTVLSALSVLKINEAIKHRRRGCDFGRVRFEPTKFITRENMAGGQLREEPWVGVWRANTRSVTKLEASSLPTLGSTNMRGDDPNTAMESLRRCNRSSEGSEGIGRHAHRRILRPSERAKPSRLLGVQQIANRPRRA